MEAKKRGRPKKAVTVQDESNQIDDPVVKKDEILELFVVRQFPHPRWVACDLNGQTLKVSISPKYTNKLNGKLIKVAKVTRGLLEQYEHIE
jgi:hypothetical protein